MKKIILSIFIVALLLIFYYLWTTPVIKIKYFEDKITTCEMDSCWDIVPSQKGTLKEFLFKNYRRPLEPSNYPVVPESASSKFKESLK